MKYTDQVIFVKNEGSEYDPVLGKNNPGVNNETTILAHVVVPSTERSTLVFGNPKADNIELHLKQPFLNTYDYCLVNIPGRGQRKYFFVAQKLVGTRQVITLKGGNDGISS